jgi:hypothetical protein
VCDDDKKNTVAESELIREDPDYEWAVISVREGGEYSVAGRTA